MEKPRSPEFSPELSIGEALAQIEAIKARVSMMGANDSEIPDLNELTRKVAAHEMTPREGVERAYRVERNKQSDH